MGERLLLVDYALLVKDVERLLLKWGYQPTIKAPKELSVAGFPQLLREHSPALVLSINYSPELAWLCTRHHLPYLSWTVDPLPGSRCVVLHGTQVELCLTFCHSRPLGTRLAAAGLRQVEHLPLAAAEHRAQPLPAASLTPYRSALTFVGSSLAAEAASLEVMLAEFGIPTGRRAEVGAVLANEFEENRDNPQFFGVSTKLWQSIQGTTCAAGWRPGEQAKLLERLNGRLAHLYRAYVVRGLSDHGLRVYGDLGWRGIARDYRGSADHGEELTRIYQASAANLDLVRLYQREIVTLRAMDTLSSGGLLLTEKGGELPQLVGEDAVVTYATLGELKERVEEVRAGAYSGVGAIAAERVQQAHQLSHRLARMLARAAQRGWLRPLEAETSDAQH